MTEETQKSISEKIDYLHTQAVAKHKKGELTEAIDFYLESIRLDENQPDWIYGNVIILLAQSKRFDEAFKLGEQAEQLHPESDVVYRARGIGFHHQNVNGNTIEKYKKAIEINYKQPKWVYLTLLKLLTDNEYFIDTFFTVRNAFRADLDIDDIYEYTGISTELLTSLKNDLENDNIDGFYEKIIKFFFSKNLWKKCIKVCNISLKINPQSQWSYHYLALSLSKLNQWEKAYSCLNKLKTINPEFWSKNHLDYLAYQNYGDILLVNQRWENSIEYYERSIELNPDFFWSYSNFGKSLLKLEKWEEARAILAKAININPLNGETLINMGEVLENQQNIKEAKKYYIQAQVIDPNNSVIQYSLERINRKETKYKNSQDKYNEYCYQAEQFKKNNQLDLAIEYYKKAIEINSSSFFAHLKIADILFSQGNFDKAKLFYQTAKSLNSDEPWIHNNLGECLVYLNKYEEAIKSYQQAINLNNSFCLSYVRCGEVLEKIDRTNEAIAMYEKALEIDSTFTLAKNNLESLLENPRATKNNISDTPNSADEYFRLGQESQQNGNLEEAIDYYNKAIQINPNFIDSYLKLADTLVDKGDLEQGIANYQKVIELEPTQVWAYNNLGVVYSHQGKLEAAIESYEKANQVNPNFALSFFRLAEVRERLGELDKTIEAYQKVLELDPNFFDTQIRMKAVVAKKEQQQAMEIAYQKAREQIVSGTFTQDQFYILDAHAGDPSGLGVVAQRCSNLGTLVENSRGVVGKVLVPGRPDEYSKMVRPENINYIWTTFESSEIPENWVNAINDYFDEVFVPHAYILKTFKQSGVYKPITVLPQSYPTRNRTKALDKQPNRLVLGIIGCPTARKNFSTLIESVVELRNEGHDIELKIHCPWLVHHTQRAWGEIPGVTLSEGKLSNEKIDQWYSQLDAYIYPSSGEGWSFTPRESMSLGIPTIISDIPVHQELVDSSYYLTINSDEWEPAYYEFLGDNCGEWKVYPINSIKKAILEMAQNYNYWQQQTKKGQKWIEQYCAWEPVQKQIMSEIFPKHIMFCSSKDTSCGIHTYSLDLVASLRDTKYVGSYEHIQKLLPRENITSIHVQQEHGITDNAELKFHSQHWNCRKQITLHSVIKEDKDPVFAELVANFDDVFVLTQDAQSEIIGSRYIPHGTDIPIQEELLSSKIQPPIVASFGFIHEKKGYRYIAEATKQLDIPWRVVGKLKKEHETRIQTWEKNIKNFDRIQHFDGFFPENKVFNLLSEASVLIFLYEDDNYLYQSGAVLKAARCQRPIICSNATPMKQLQGCVHYVPYGDIEALKIGINLILDNPDYGKTLVTSMNNYLKNNHWKRIGMEIRKFCS